MGRYMYDGVCSVCEQVYKRVILGGQTLFCTEQSKVWPRATNKTSVCVCACVCVRVHVFVHNYVQVQRFMRYSPGQNSSCLFSLLNPLHFSFLPFFLFFFPFSFSLWFANFVVMFILSLRREGDHWEGWSILFISQ